MQKQKDVRQTADAAAFIDAAKHYVSESVVQACSEIIGRAFGGDALQTVVSCLSTINVSSVIIADDAETVEPKWRLRVGNTNVLPCGGAVAITGEAKQGKTQLLTIFSSVMLSGRAFGMVEQGEPLQGKILWFDTEQEVYHICKNRDRLKKIVQDEFCAMPQIYRLKPFTQSERVLIITKEIVEQQPSMVIIDGVRDLVRDINDQEETQRVLQWLKILSDYVPECTFMLVIHYNPGSRKMRGALGTEITNFAASTFECSVQPDAMQRHFVVKQTLTRDAQMPDFKFYFDINGDLQPYQ